MKNLFLSILSAATLGACNFVNLKPDSMDKSETIFALYGGYQMRHAVKQELENRGWDVTVGRKRGAVSMGGSEYESAGFANMDPMDARYIIQVREITPGRGVTIFQLDPFICVFNGFHWWIFNVSIADQETGEELLSWSGRGCMNGNIRRFNRYMNRLEK